MRNKEGHILSHKTSLDKFKMIQAIQSTFLNYNGIKLELNNKTHLEHPLNICKRSIALLYNSLVKEVIEVEI